MNVKAVRQICLWTALSRAKSTVSSATSTIDIHVNLHANRSLGGEHRGTRAYTKWEQPSPHEAREKRKTGLFLVVASLSRA